MTTLAALIFDFDGTIAETERDGHRVAYNAAFAQERSGWEWDVPTYGALLAIAGGKERLDHYIAGERPEIVPAARATLVARLHETKRQHFDGLADSLPMRPGILRLVREAREAGVRCAIATTAAPSGVDALLRRDPEFARTFEVIVAGDVVPRKKPAPDIYLLALERLGIAASDAVAFEDSAVGLRAARAAGIATVVTPSVYTRGESFDGAAAVIEHLGDPGDAPRVIAGAPVTRGVVDLGYLRTILAGGSQSVGNSPGDSP
ncbi:MAG: HAD family hydrolase [Vulcanimicrobiaceae bacterium]